MTSPVIKPSSPKFINKPRVLISSMLSGDKRSLARLMTFVDNRHEELVGIMRQVHPEAGSALKIGITGPPGAGKSTLVDKLIKIYRLQNKTVGVVAIDPSSPFSGGALLGDRIRMIDHAADEGVFIRSLGSRGSHGGLSRATRDVTTLMDAAGFNMIIIETVGVGQTELDIMAVADVTVVVLVPESGDTIQTMKAGLLEIADIFVVNKADREGADRIFAELKSLSGHYASTEKHHRESDQIAKRPAGEADVPVLKVEAVNNKGVELLAETIRKKAAFRVRDSGYRKKISRLLKEECLDILLAETHNRLDAELSEKGELSKNYKGLIDDHHNPYQTATEILEKWEWRKSSR